MKLTSKGKTTQNVFRVAYENLTVKGALRGRFELPRRKAPVAIHANNGTRGYRLKPGLATSASAPNKIPAIEILPEFRGRTENRIGLLII